GGADGRHRQLGAAHGVAPGEGLAGAGTSPDPDRGQRVALPARPRRPGAARTRGPGRDGHRSVAARAGAERARRAAQRSGHPAPEWLLRIPGVPVLPCGSSRSLCPNAAPRARRRPGVMTPEEKTMKPFAARIAILASLALAALAVAFPATAASVRPIRFDHLSLEQGLSQSSVMDILQDRRGYIWLATEDGLDRYDGLSFKVYKHDPADAASLPSSFVWDVDEDAAGNVWAATTSGLAMWERATDRVVPQQKLAGKHIRVVRFDAKKNAVWVGTRDGGLLRLDLATGSWTSFAHDPADPASLVDNRISALYVDGKARLWVGTEGGLDLLEGGGRRFTHFVTNPPD